VSAVGSYLGRAAPELSLDGASMKMGGRTIFTIDAAVEDELFEHMKQGLLSDAQGVSLPYPPHERCVEIEVDLAAGSEGCTVHGSDLTKEYVEINADYRS
jgi:glutamate N-acetyltransferase/amino-acid N-acetyltransferase